MPNTAVHVAAKIAERTMRVRVGAVWQPGTAECAKKMQWQLAAVTRRLGSAATIRVQAAARGVPRCRWPRDVTKKIYLKPTKASKNECDPAAAALLTLLSLPRCVGHGAAVLAADVFDGTSFERKLERPRNDHVRR